MINRYLLDEHVHPEYRTQILRREPNLTVFIIGDPGAPANIPGIFTLNSDMSIGETVEELILLAKASFDNEFLDTVIYLTFT